MLYSLTRYARRLARNLKAPTAGRTPTRRAALTLESLEGRTLLSASPVAATFTLDDNGNLSRNAGGKSTPVAAHVREFETDSKGEVFTLDTSDTLRVLGRTGTTLKTETEVKSIAANTSDDAVEALHTNGELEELNGTKATQLASGVDDFKVNSTGAVDVRHAGEVDEVSARRGKRTKLASDAKDFQENASGRVEILHSSGELDEWNGSKSTKLAGGVDDFKVNSTGAVDVRRAGELDEIASGRTTKLATGVKDFQENAGGEVEILHSSGELDARRGGKTTKLAGGVDDFAVNSTGAVDVRRAGEVDEIASGKTTKLASGVDDFRENAHGAVDILFASGELEEWRGGRLSQVASNVASFTEDGQGSVEVHHGGGSGGRHGGHGADD